MNNERKLPAYPLFIKDPNFSLWSATDNLNGSNIKSWFGAEKKICGFVKTDGQTYCFMGNAEDYTNCGVKKAKQTAVEITAFTTDYEFVAGKVNLKLRFVSPLPLNDLRLLSMPVCYMKYSIKGDKNAELSVFVNRRIAYNDIPENADKSVRGGVMPHASYETAFMGLKRQLPLSNAHDLIGADWGWWYLSGERAYILDESDIAAYLSAGLKNFANNGEEKYIGSINSDSDGVVMLGFDEGVAIDYFGDYLKGYYLSNNTILDALTYVYENTGALDEKLKAFDENIKDKAQKYGEEYLRILYASLRQSIGAHKLVCDNNGNILFLSKECGSNGCIATVDVSYPSAPLYLLYNTELVKGMMRPILKFARMPVWKYDFAPHDVGTYPICAGQVYALKGDKGHYHGNYNERTFVNTLPPIYLLPSEFDAYDFKYQMPVEECANMLILFLACCRAENDNKFFDDNKDLCAKWVEYLVKYGLKPEDQLCTDDFAGHLKNNLNLAIKATVGIAAYAELARDGEYRKIAEKYAGEITQFIEKFGHSPLTWDSGEDTFSLKYNLAFDKIFKLCLFSQSLLESEVDYCLTKTEKCGIPLDSRKGYTKSDWLLWTASLTDDPEKRKRIITPIYRFLTESQDRVPFSDWYETADGKHHHFIARSVQGGCFILLLRENNL